MDTHRTCRECNRALLPDWQWRLLPHRAKRVLVSAGWSRHIARDLCFNDYRRARLAGEFGEYRLNRDRTEVLAEWRFLHEAGELNLEDSQARRIKQAAPRIGMKPQALERCLLRAKRDGLLAA